MPELSEVESDRSDRRRTVLVGVQAWLAICGVGLVAATWPLWTPQQVFPQIPFVRWAGALPVWLDWIGLGVMLVSLAVAGSLPKRRFGRWALGSFAVATTALVLVDQHRFQPWAWHFVLLALTLASQPARRATFWVVLLTASVYLHSGLSKLDASFVHSHGQTFVVVAADLFGLDSSAWPERVRVGLALVFPVGELLVVAALALFPRRRLWLVLSFLLHGALLLLLGPWGLDHRPGVLLWNVYFLGQNALLFWATLRPSSSGTRKGEGSHPLGLPARLATTVLATAVLLPFLEPFGGFDAWPSWAVYATRAEQVEIEIRGDAVERLPPEVREHVADGADDAFTWRRLAVDRWSLAAVWAPTYPQSRFTLGVGLAVAERFGLENEIRAVVRGPADRLTGRRWTETVTGREELERLAERYCVNLHAVRP